MIAPEPMQHLLLDASYREATQYRLIQVGVYG